MAKTDSEQEFEKRFRQEKIIKLDGIDSREKLFIALNRANINGSKQRTIAFEVMHMSEIKRHTETTQFYYHGRPAKYVGRYQREEIIRVRGYNQKRIRDVKTGRFTKKVEEVN